MPDLKVRIFVSYKHDPADEDILNELMKFIHKPIINAGGEFWSDKKIEWGSDWDGSIQDHLQIADIGLILVSQLYLNSTYIEEKEITILLERRKRKELIILPLILAPCEWENYAWLAGTQFLPEGGKTVRQHYREYADREGLYTIILTRLKSHIEKIKGLKTGELSQNNITITDSERLIAERWKRSFVTIEHQIRYPYRDIMTHSCILGTDESGHGLGRVDLQTLQHRVVATDDLFRTWKADLEWDGILSIENQGVISDDYFAYVKAKVLDAYHPYSELVEGFTTHKVLNMLYSSSGSDKKALIKLIEQVIHDCLEITPEVLGDNIISFRSSSNNWLCWIEVHLGPEQITNDKLLLPAYKTLLSSYNQQSKNRYFYLQFGPSFGLDLSREARDFQNIYIFWALSVISFIRGLKDLRKDYSPSELQKCFPNFLAEQQDTREGIINYTHSATLGFQNYRECLG
jgi:TIR domain